MLLTPLPDGFKHLTRLLLLLHPFMTLALLDQPPCFIILPPPFMIRITLRPRHAHLYELPRHIHAYEVLILVENQELFPEGGGGFEGYGDGAEAPEGEEVGFVGLECQDALFAAGYAVGVIDLGRWFGEDHF